MAKKKTSSKTSGPGAPDDVADETTFEVGEGGLADVLKKMAYLGVGTMFATQETASRMVKDMTLPREAVNAIVNAIERNRDEIARAVSKGTEDFLRNLDIVHLAKKTFDGMNIRVSGEIQFNYDPTTRSSAKTRSNTKVSVGRKSGGRGRKRGANSEPGS